MIPGFLSRISVRLLLFNILLVFLPVAGLFSLRSLELQLLDLQERSMVQQGRLVAAALSRDPAALSAQSSQQLLQRLAGRSEARIRIVDRAQNVLADSAITHAPVTAPVIKGIDSYEPAEGRSRTRLLYRIGAFLWRPIKTIRDASRPEPKSDKAAAALDQTPRGVLQRALAGRYGATLRESAGQRSLTLYTAIPIRAGGSGSVIGAVVVSQSTSRILRALWRVRLDVFRVFVLSVAAAVVLSLLLSATIARPIVRLRDEADTLLDPRGRLQRTFRGSHRRDEIGDLTRALEKLTGRLERHLAFVETFSADVSHEFKNPLASIRSAAELLPTTDDEVQREKLARTIITQVHRLDRLLNGVREISRIDAALERETVATLDAGAIVMELPAVADPRDGTTVEVLHPKQPLLVAGSAERLAQALGNVIDNAVSFSPPGGRVVVTLRAEGSEAVIQVDDQGPGIPEKHLEKIFDRFFSFRDVAERRNHDGLGLSITKAIVEGYGGRVTASNRPDRGARIEVRLPRRPGPDTAGIR